MVGLTRPPGGRGVRCFGFLSNDGSWAHCSRPEHAGSLVLKDTSQTYTHMIDGKCLCGKEHSLVSQISSIASSSNGRHIVATYDYEDQAGKQFQVVKYSPKGFSQRRRDENGMWVNNLQGISRPLPLYRLKELLSADPKVTVHFTEGEEDANRLRSLDLMATTTVMGAGNAKHSDLTPSKAEM